jgi:catechol 2,3-dioxygenase-like lactoylglutathione lyase family enzyme
MRKIIIRAVLLAILTPVIARSQSAQQVQRPKIFGIAGVRILVSVGGASDSRDFYSRLFPLDHPCIWCGAPHRITFSVNESQFIELVPSPLPLPSKLIDEITFSTDDLSALKRFLAAHNIPVKTPVIGFEGNPALLLYAKSNEQPQSAQKPAEADAYIQISDPEGHRIGFVQSYPEAQTEPGGRLERRLIHAGFVVKDRALEDTFYKDLLGFRVYWHGGMSDGQTDWVDMQVSDGTDWVEYMLNVSRNADKKELGVMNHIAIGVYDIEAANFVAKKSGIPVKEEPKIGRDGKWQLNLYDPDETRVELMEFTPVEKPCCSEYTGPHPKP